MNLYRQWCRAGFEPDSFWRQTPRLAHIAILERLKQSREDRGWLAWTTAALGRVKSTKFPKLDKIMGVVKRRRRLTWQEQLAVARAWVSAANRDDKGRGERQAGTDVEAELE